MCEVADKIHEFYLQLIELDIVSIQQYIMLYEKEDGNKLLIPSIRKMINGIYNATFKLNQHPEVSQIEELPEQGKQEF